MGVYSQFREASPIICNLFADAMPRRILSTRFSVKMVQAERNQACLNYRGAAFNRTFYLLICFYSVDNIIALGDRSTTIAEMQKIH